MSQEKKIKFMIDFKKKGVTSRFVWFCIFGVIALALLIQALVYQIKGIFTSNNAFLIFFPIICLIIDFFIGRKIILLSQPE